MKDVLRTLAIRLVLCTTATWLVWKAGFDTGVALGLYGIALAAVKLRRWVEREIFFPARRKRQRLGIRTESPLLRASE